MNFPHRPAIPSRKPAGRPGGTSGCRISNADTILGIHPSATAGFLVRIATATE
jgi:hypothetical protein